MATMVAGELKERLFGQLFEIERQLRQARGYPYSLEALKLHLQDAIEGRFPRRVMFPILRKVTLAEGDGSLTRLLAEVERSGYRTSLRAKHFVEQKRAQWFDQRETHFDLVAVTLAQLGFSHGAVLRDIYHGAWRLGLVGVEDRVALTLRLDYAEQKKGESLLIASGGREIFRVERDSDDRWLSISYSSENRQWPADSCWVFNQT